MPAADPSSPWPGRPFRLFFSAASVSVIGTFVSSVALPLLAVLTLHATTFEVALLSALELLGWLLLGLPAGVWVDRHAHQPLMLAMDAVRGVALASVPIAVAFDALTIGQLLAVAAVVGLATVPFSLAEQAFVPAIVPEAALFRGNAVLQGSDAFGQVAGPSIGGLLVQAIGAASTVIVDAASYALSFLCLAAIRVRDDRRDLTAEHTPMRESVRVGVAFLRNHQVLRQITISLVVLNGCFAAQGALEVVFLVRTLHARPGLVGVLLATSGVGGLLGAASGARVASRVGTARTLWLVLLGEPLFSAVIVCAQPGWGLVLFGIGALGVGYGVVLFNIAGRTWRQQVVPAAIFGRVLAAQRVVTFGTSPLAAVAAGALAAGIGVRAALGVFAALRLGGPLALMRTDIPRLRDLPAPAGASTG